MRNVLNKFYDDVKSFLVSWDLLDKPERIYNIDESWFNGKNETKQSKVVVLRMFAVGHFPILTNSLTLQIFCNIDLYTHINISSMNASSFVYIDVVIICTIMSFYQQILHSFSCYKVLCIGNLAYAGHFAVSPSMLFQYSCGA